MENPFAFSLDNKRYHTLAYENRKRGRKIYKAAVDGGFTCPNIDGTKGIGGCIYCSGGSGYFTAPAAVCVKEQVEAEMQRIRTKTPDAMAVAYFQAHTNTYAPASVLRKMYTQALSVEGICGLAIATRADALNAEILDLLEELNTELTVELGLQTIHDSTAKRINRGHSFAEFLGGYRALKARNIRVCVHLINGLPGETPAMMAQSAKAVGRLRPEGIKLHLLHIIRGTPMERLYLQGEYTPLTREEYIQSVCTALTYFPPETVIERVTGDGDKRTLLAPQWSADKIAVLGGIDKYMVQQDLWQGKNFGEECENVTKIPVSHK